MAQELKQALSSIVDPPFTKGQIEEKLEKKPADILELKSKVAGHDNAIFYHQDTLNIMKPIFDVRGVREETFYKILFDPKHDKDEILAILRQFVPTYIGSVTLEEVRYIKLNDLTTGTVNPSLMDVKMGHRTYDRRASDEKIKHETTKDYLSRRFGFKVLAIRKWIDDKAAYEERNRDCCRSMQVVEDDAKSLINIKNALTFYFKQSDEVKAKELKAEVMNQLTNIRNWFEERNVKLYEFIASSVFIVYSFHAGKLDCRVKLIDFAHIFQLDGSLVPENKTRDESYLRGLRFFMELVENTKMY